MIRSADSNFSGVIDRNGLKKNINDNGLQFLNYASSFLFALPTYCAVRQYQMRKQLKTL